METTYTSLRENLASVLDKVIQDQEVVFIRRKGSEDVAMIPASELSSLMETAHLLRSPKNARLLLAALARSQAGKIKPGSLEDLRRHLEAK